MSGALQVGLIILTLEKIHSATRTSSAVPHLLPLGLFAAASYQKTVRDKYEAIPTTALYYTTCLVVFVIAVGLLVIGLWNATLLLSEKGFYGLAYFLSLFGAVAVQKNVRDVWDPTRLREPLSVTEEGPET